MDRPKNATPTFTPYVRLAALGPVVNGGAPIIKAAELSAMLLTYLIRYGLMRHIGQFRAPAEAGAAFFIGVRLSSSDRIAARTSAKSSSARRPRGTGFGREDRDSRKGVTPSSTAAAIEPGVSNERLDPRILCGHSRRRSYRQPCFLMCQGVVDENGWPWELLDLKTLLRR